VRRLAPLIALAGLALGLAPGARARAAPVIDIKAQTQLQLDRVRLLSDGRVEVRGALVDRLTGDGIADQPVIIRIGSDDPIGSASTTTKQDGKFTAIVSDAPGGEQRIELSFGGRGLLDRAEPFIATVDPARAQVALALRAEEAPGGANLIVTATVDDQPAELPVQLLFGPIDGPPRNSLEIGHPG